MGHGNRHVQISDLVNKNMSEVQTAKTLLILRATPAATAAAEQFLRNRDWIVHSTDSLKDFLTFIIQHKPNFVMISVDHPNKKVAVMPKILTQSFPVCVFTFAESSSTPSFRKLQDIACDYKINPPATGPAIERAANKFGKDTEKKLKKQNEKAASENAGQPVSPGADQDSIHATWAQGASTVFSQLFEGDDTEKPDASILETAGLDKVLSDDPTKVAADKAKLNAKDKAASSSWIPSETKEPIAVKAADGAVAAKSSEQKSEQKAKTTGEPAGFINGDPITGDGSDLTREKNNSPEIIGRIEGEKNEASPTLIKSQPARLQPTYSESDVEESDQPKTLVKNADSFEIVKEKSSGEKETAQASEIEQAKPKNLRAPKRYDHEQKIVTVMGKNGTEAKNSLIVEGAKQALVDSVEIRDGQVERPLEDSSQVACIVIESTRFNGYMISALGKNRKMDGKFVTAVKEKLYKFLNDNGETVSDKENMNLKIKKVEFEEWALEYADFMKTSVHHGDEIAMAFFPVTKVRPEVGDSASTTMASLKLVELEGDKVVEFNMYVYLPNNKKYILYTPKGGKFYTVQKDRLTVKGVKDVHMLKSEVGDLSKYKAQNYLDNLIDSYKKKKPKGGSSVA